MRLKFTDWGWTDGFITTRVGLLRGGRGGVLSAGTLAAQVTLPGPFLTVATLALDPMESLLDAMLSFEGDEVPLCPALCTVEMLSVEADIPLAPAPISSILIR